MCSFANRTSCHVHCQSKKTLPVISRSAAWQNLHGSVHAGNLAGDCREFCAILVANGAVLPLLSLVLRSRQPSESPAADLEAAETAAWALSALTKQSSQAVSASKISVTASAQCMLRSCHCAAERLQSHAGMAMVYFHDQPVQQHDLCSRAVTIWDGSIAVSMTGGKFVGGA